MTKRPNPITTISTEAAKNDSLRIMVQAMYYKKNFNAFVEDAWKIIEPGVDYSHNWHIDYLMEEVLTMFGGVIADVYPDADWDTINANTSRRMVINIPTRAMKTILISVMMPVWLSIHKPTLAFATVSYSDDLATEINNKRRTIISSDWFQTYFGDVVKIDKGSNRQDKIEFISKGMMYSTSIAGTFTGKGADIIILDDPQKPGDMGSPTERAKVVNFFQETLPTRLNNMNTGVIINIQQRLHHEDLTGYILNNMPSYELVKVPLDFTYEQTFVGPLSGKVWDMKQGDVLWEGRFNRKSVETLRTELGSRNFESQQQQNPTPDGGTILDREWFQTYDGTPRVFLDNMRVHEPERFAQLQIVQSWDMNYTVNIKTDSDYIGYLSTAYDASTDATYILDAWKRRLPFTETLQQVLKEREKYEYLERPITILIEKKANGGPIIQVLDQQVAGIKPFEPGANSKIARMESAAPTVESGHVFIPAEGVGLSWREELVGDLVKFPYVTHDDIADAFSQVIINNHILNRKARTYDILFF